MQQRRRSFPSRVVFLLAATAAVALGAPAVRAQSSRVGTSPGLFEYHSAFWVNLHHFLYERARGLNGYDKGRAIVAAAVADTAGVERLDAAERRAWAEALEYYRVHLAPHDLLERDMAGIKAALGDRENQPTLDGASIDDSLRLVLESVAPSYRRIWWPRHDAANRRWIAVTVPLIAAHGDTMARLVSLDFHVPWSTFLIRVDASAYSSWAGAYTTVYPDRITIASLDSSYLGSPAVEMLFHESLHTLTDSVDAALTAAAVRQGKRLPGDLVHAMIFYTAGDAAQRAMPGYQPYAYRLGIWSRGAFPGYLPDLRANWQPFLDGVAGFAESIDRVVAGLP